MFTPGERNRVRELLLRLAETDAGVAAAAITGSHAAGGGDEWSDIDLAFAIPSASSAANRADRVADQRRP